MPGLKGQFKKNRFAKALQDIESGVVTLDLSGHKWPAQEMQNIFQKIKGSKVERVTLADSDTGGDEGMAALCERVSDGTLKVLNLDRATISTQGAQCAEALADAMKSSASRLEGLSLAETGGVYAGVSWPSRDRR
jgi:hypothetical protein